MKRENLNTHFEKDSTLGHLFFGSGKQAFITYENCHTRGHRNNDNYRQAPPSTLVTTIDYSNTIVRL